jgi:hypothetical protein
MSNHTDYSYSRKVGLPVPRRRRVPMATRYRLPIALWLVTGLLVVLYAGWRL